MIERYRWQEQQPEPEQYVRQPQQYSPYPQEQRQPMPGWQQPMEQADPGQDFGQEEQEDDTQHQVNAVGRWFGMLLACVVVGAGVGIAIVGLMKFVNGPVTAKATSDPISAARQSIAPTPATNKFRGQEIEMTYPSVFDQVGDQKTAPGSLDSYFLSSKTSSGLTMALAVVNLTNNSLDNDSSYKYRSVSPQLYKATDYSHGGQKIVLMTKLDNTEATLFWAYKNMDLNLSITSTDPHYDVQALMRQIYPTLRWLK